MGPQEGSHRHQAGDPKVHVAEIPFPPRERVDDGHHQQKKDSRKQGRPHVSRGLAVDEQERGDQQDAPSHRRGSHDGPDKEREDDTDHLPVGRKEKATLKSPVVDQQGAEREHNGSDHDVADGVLEARHAFGRE